MQSGLMVLAVVSMVVTLVTMVRYVMSGHKGHAAPRILSRKSKSFLDEIRRVPTCRDEHMQPLRVTHMRKDRSIAKAGCDFEVPSRLFTTPVRSLRRSTCAVVASSGILKGSQCATAINAHDFVLRMNYAPTRGFETDVGNRTSMIILNSHNARKLKAEVIRGGHRPCSRTPNGLARACSEVEYACAGTTHLSLFGDEWTPDDNETKTARIINRLSRCSALGADALAPMSKVLKLRADVGAFHGAFSRQLDAALTASRRKQSKHCDPQAALQRGASKCLATTGFIGVHLMLAMCARVTLFGLREVNSSSRAGFHYYDKVSGAGGLKSAQEMAHTHDSRAEKAYYQRLQTAAGAVRVCHY